jgi:hypothetical protein
MHMGLNPETGGWACWRDPTHRGRNVPKMIKAVLGVPWQKAIQLAGDWKDPGAVAWDDLNTQVRNLDVVPRDLQLQSFNYPLPSFREIKRESSLTRNHWNYLRKRGFPGRHIARLCRVYQIRAGVNDKWRNRVILPFIDRRGKVSGWQGRAVGKHAELRYISHPDSSGVKNLLFNFGPAFNSKRRKVLVIVEGPLDTLKVDFYGRSKGIRAVGTLGTSFMDAQVSQLYLLAPRFDRVLILFDPEAEGPAWELANRLSTFSPIVGSVPEGVEDPGDLYPDEVVSTIRDLVHS